MNYKQHYQNLMERAPKLAWSGIWSSAPKWKQRDGHYREGHRIIPECSGGKYTCENVVYLLPEEHFVAHQLLVKMYPGNKKLIYAVRMMCVKDNNQQRNNKEYGWLKRKRIKALQGNKIHLGHKQPQHVKDRMTKMNKEPWKKTIIANRNRDFWKNQTDAFKKEYSRKMYEAKMKKHHLTAE